MSWGRSQLDKAGTWGRDAFCQRRFRVYGTKEKVELLLPGRALQNLMKVGGGGGEGEQAESF